jgi:SAM-dependent methyltransferase
MTTQERWNPYVDRYRQGECRDRILHDLILADAHARGEGLTFLDIGCGRGFDTDVPLQRSLANAAGRYIGIEPDPAITPGEYFSETHCCFFEDAPLPQASIDVAFAVMVLEHLKTPERFWSKLHDVLKPGGVFWGLTVDARHWFCRASLWAERFKIKDLYLNTLFGKRGSDRYENYPVYYRTNTPEQIRRFTRRFHACDFVNFSKVGQCTWYFPRRLHPVVEFFEQRAVRLGKPGSLLAVRVQK